MRSRLALSLALLAILVVAVGINDDIRTTIHTGAKTAGECRRQSLIAFMTNDASDSALLGQFGGTIPATVVNHEHFDRVDPR